MMEFYQFICMAIFMLVLADACLWVDLTKHFDNNVETTARVWKKNNAILSYYYFFQNGCHFEIPDDRK